MKRLVPSLLIAAVLAGATAPTAYSQPFGDPYGGRQQDQARAAVQGGRVRPLEEIIAAISRRSPGQVLSASAPIFQPDGRAIYRILWDSRGQQLEYIVDARSGAILSVNGN